MAISRQWQAINQMLNEEEVKERVAVQEAKLQLVDDWHHQKKPQDRLEADLNPAINKMRPINPDETGISAAQKFRGEDVSLKERNRIQARQVRAWCDAEMEQKRRMAEEEKENARLQVEADKEIDVLRLQAEVEAVAAQKQLVLDLAEHNRLLAAEKRAERKMAKLRERTTNAWEIDSAMQNPVLAEHNYGRRRRDHYKGMSQAEVEDIHQFNAMQVQEIQEARQHDKDEDYFWAARNTEINSYLFEVEAQEEADKAAARYELNDDHRHQKREFKQRETFQKQQLGTGGVSNAFYSQFGSDCTNRRLC